MPQSYPAQTVLVVEDDDAIAEQVVGVLRTEGYVVLHAGDGATALSVLETIKVDLMLLDLMLPTMSGWELLEERDRRKLQHWAAVVLFSAHRDAVSQIAPGTYDGTLMKPFSVRDLVGAVERYIREALARRERPT